MISVVIASIAIAAALTLGYSAMNAYRDHRNLLLIERSGRVSLEKLTSAIRTASPGVPTGNILDLVTCGPNQALRVTSSSTAPDEITMIYAVGGIYTSARADFRETTSSLTVLNPTGIAPGDSVVVTNFQTGVFVQVRGVTASTVVDGAWDLVVGTPSTLCPVVPAFNFAPGSMVIRSTYARFYVDSSSAVGGVPTLMLDRGDPDLPHEPVADGIEDLQIAIGVDLNGNGDVFEADDGAGDEWFHNSAADLGLAVPTLADNTWRALRLTVVARAPVETGNNPIYIRPAAEDRAAASAPDPYRRRIMMTTVEIRNLEGSP